jgi:hypothetical protein
VEFTVIGPSGYLVLNNGMTDPDDPTTLLKRTMKEHGRCVRCSMALRLARSRTTTSSAMSGLDAPIMFCGRTGR